MTKKLHIDIETYSSIELKTSGVYAYAASIDFEVLLLAYAFNDEPIHVVDLAQGEKLPARVVKALVDPNVLKLAHNAAFERTCLTAIGYETSIASWSCSMVKSSYCGYPLGLGPATEAIGLLDNDIKDSKGKALIRYFCVPCKPTKVNGGRFRNLWYHDMTKWIAFKEYCIQDVVAERALTRKLSKYDLPDFELENYILDQKINDAGVRIDIDFATKALAKDNEYKDRHVKRIEDLTRVANGNSPAQLKEWLSLATNKAIKTLAKDALITLIEETGPGPVREVLQLRQKVAKTSTKKLVKMLSCAGPDDRARGLFQFYGASKTGRWAGRLIQLQNLPRTYIKDIHTVKEDYRNESVDYLELVYGNVADTLSELIRPCFVAAPGKVLGVVDFSAIEARVIAWIAGEKWRLDIFKTHGKIYEASASKMFRVPIEEVTKTSDYRARGKVAELALGYQGAEGALKEMGGERLGLSTFEMKRIVKAWRKANPAIVAFWADVEKAFKDAIGNPYTVYRLPYLKFHYDEEVATITLPSGRELFYPSPSFGLNRWKRRSITYEGVDQYTRKWSRIDTYGGKLTENIVQAIARDLLADAMLRIDAAGFKIIGHVHDEVITELDDSNAFSLLRDIMKNSIPWAPGLPLDADGYTSNFYKKD